MEIAKAWNFDDNQIITIDGREYNIHECLRKAVDLPVKELPLEDFYICYCSPTKDTFRSFLEHCKMVYDADTDYPILLNENGAILDGKHRLAKALIFGHTTIKAKRFVTDPPSGWSNV